MLREVDRLGRKEALWCKHCYGVPKSAEQWSNDNFLFMRGSITDNVAYIKNMKFIKHLYVPGLCITERLLMGR